VPSSSPRSRRDASFLLLLVVVVVVVVVVVKQYTSQDENLLDHLFSTSSSRGSPVVKARDLLYSKMAKPPKTAPARANVPKV
jgi:hypothetical protein